MKSQRRNDKSSSQPEKRKKNKGGGGGKMESGSGRWMLTYLDMVTLLFGVFIIMFAMSNVNKAKVEQLAESLRNAFHGGLTIYMEKNSGGLTHYNDPRFMPGTTKELLEFIKSGLSDVQPEVASRHIRIIEEERGVIITLTSDVFFASGSAEIDIDVSREVLQAISGMLVAPQLSNRKFRIEGHTDNIAPASDKFATNWELSVMRAVNVLHYLADFGVNENQFQVAGFGDTVPLMSNDTEEGRAYNRRVDIVILSDAHL